MKRIFIAKELKDEVALVLLLFWSTVIAIRLLVAERLEDQGRQLGLVINGVHIHHFVIGFVLILVALLLYFLSKKRKGLMVLVPLSVGIALIFDEFVYWSHREFDYWAIENFLAIIITGVLLFLIYHLPEKRSEITDNCQPRLNPRHPFVSVVIPAFNEEKFLPATLRSLVRQDYQDFEIIVVDNNSSDRTAAVAKSWGAKVAFEEKRGVGAARERGFREAQGEIIVTTDADAILPSHWLSRIVQEFKDQPDLAAFGGLYTLSSGPMVARLAVRYGLYWVWLLDRCFSGSWALPGVNLAVRRKAFAAAGGFNPELILGEDADLAQRIKNFGRVKFDPHFKVQTSGRRYRYGLLHALLTYAPNGITRMLFKKHKFLSLPTIRNERSIIQSFIVIPLFLAGFLLFALFYLNNPTISQAREIRQVEQKATLIKTKARQAENEIKFYLAKTPKTKIKSGRSNQG